MSAEQRICKNCKSEFTVEPEDFAFYEKIKVPPPTFCPDCRAQRRMALRNERCLYKDVCDLCKKPMVSVYSPDKPFTVYCHDCWYSDKWDALAYGRAYDWNTPFFAQWAALLKEVPRINLMQMRGSTNSEYANFTIDIKNVYLSYSVLNSENVYYGRTVDDSKESFDCFNVKNSEIVYENVDCARNYRTHFALRSRDCIESAFLFDCANCQNCFMSSNLRSRQYVFRNRQLTKDGYKTEMAKVDMGNAESLSALKREFAEMRGHALHKFASVLKVQNCSGDNIENAKNVHMGFDIYNSENVKFGTRVIGGRDVYDVYGSKTELAYEGVASGLDSFNNRFMVFADSMKDSDYFEWSQHSSHLFGCSGIRKKSHCILNKQYTEEAYEVLVPKIIEHMQTMPYTDRRGRVCRYGEMFPIEQSQFAYNETLAQEHYPMSKEEALAEGYAWRDPEPSSHTPTMQAGGVPDNIKDAQDSIINEVIACSSCARVYRIVKPELDFLRHQGIALPRKCLECRYQDRFSLRNPLKLWHRACQCDGASSAHPSSVLPSKEGRLGGVYANTATHFHGGASCPNEFETSYAPDRPEIVYCEACYNAEVA